MVGFEQLHLAQGEALEIALSSGDPLSELPRGSLGSLWLASLVAV